MKALFRYFDGYRRQLVLGPLFKLTEAVLELFVPLLMANIIDVGIKNGDVKYVVTHGLFMLGLGAVGLACALTCQYFAAVCAQGFGRSLRKDLFRHVFSLSQAEYGSVGTNSLITRLTSDVNQVQTGVNMFIRLAIRAPFLTVGSIVMAFTINWKIALVFLLSTPLIVFVLYRVMSRSLPEYTRIQRQQDVISRLAGENLEGARVIRAFSKQDSEIEQFQQAGDTLSDITIRVGKLSAALNPITSVIANLAIVAIVWFGGLFAQDGGIEQGQIIAMVNYMTQTLLALIVLANIIVILTKALASAKRVSEVLAQESSMPEPRQSAAEKPGAPRIEFESVRFAYPDAGEDAVEGVSFSIQPGQTLGIIGGTGCGKTTLVRLLTRDYDVTGGAVRVDGTDVREYTSRRLHAKIGLVPQAAQLFSGTVRDIGLIYTQLCTIDNKDIYVPNSDLSASKIVNYNREPQRRVDLTFGADYTCRPEQVKAALHNAVSLVSGILPEPAPFVRVAGYGESNIDYVVRVWCKTADYWTVYYDLMEAVGAAFDAHGVSMSYPQMNVHVLDTPESAKKD